MNIETVTAFMKNNNNLFFTDIKVKVLECFGSRNISNCQQLKCLICMYYLNIIF